MDEWTTWPHKPFVSGVITPEVISESIFVTEALLFVQRVGSDNAVVTGPLPDNRPPFSRNDLLSQLL